MPPNRVAAGPLRRLNRPLRYARAVATAGQEPVGPTPRELVWALHGVRLYHYPAAPTGDLRRPLLLVYAIINRPFIFDLRPNRSFVEHLIGEGFDVYLLDWGDPDPADGETTFDDYAAEYLPRALRRVLRHSGADELDVLGYCLGACIVLAHGALFPEAPVANLVLLTAPIRHDTLEPSTFDRWMDERWFDIDQLASAFERVPAGLIDVASMLLKPVPNLLGTYLSLWRRLDDDDAVRSWRALHRWVHDGVGVPAATLQQWVRSYVWQDAFVAGTRLVRGRRLEPARVTVPILNVVARQDHIVADGQASGLTELVGSTDVETIAIDAGHVGVMVGSRAQRELWPLVVDWLDRHGPPRV